MAGFATLLGDLDDGETPLPDPAADAGAAFRYVYDGFVRRGDYDRGKPRHAVRQIKQWLGDNQVRSLETKLAGKTWLRSQDAFFLLKLFLSRWNYDRTKNKYTAYAKGDLDELTNALLADLFPEDTKAILLPTRSRNPENVVKTEIAAALSTPSPLERTKKSGIVIRQHFAEGDALVTISRVRTIIDTMPERAMTGFNELMADLYKIDRRDERSRAAIWVIDLGMRNNKVAARGTIYNVHLLAAQFRAIALIKAPGHQQLFNWLRQNTCVIVGSLSHDEIDWIYDHAHLDLPRTMQDIPWIQFDRLFLESVPGRWLDAEDSDVFGKTQGALWRTPTITAHLRLEDWDDVDHPDELDNRKNLRYFFHGSITPSPDDPTEAVRCIPLPEPGSRWSDAYRAACYAAFARLKRRPKKLVDKVDTPMEALSLLRDQHFVALSLDEFLELPNLLIKSVNQKSTPG